MDSAIRKVLVHDEKKSLPTGVSDLLSPEALEYVAVKQEQQTRLILRDTALYVTIGGIIAVGPSLGSLKEMSASAAQIALAATAMFSLAMFLIYFRNDYYLSSARRFVVRDIGPRLADHIAITIGSPLSNRRSTHSFGWETFHRTPRSIWLLMRIVSAAVALTVFLAPMALSVLVICGTMGIRPGLADLIIVGTSGSLICIGVARLSLFD